jgi:hypothetical protein
MQLVFLDRLNLAYKDYGYVDKDFEIALDLVIIQKSLFTINKSKLNVSVGDIVILKDAPIHYIGIVERLEVADKHRTTVHVLDFKEMFSIDIPVESYTGDLSLYLENMLVGNFKQSNDPLQNLNYLTIERGSSVQGELSFEPDKIMSLASVMELITKSYGLRLTNEAVYLRGRVTGIIFRIGEVQRGIKLKNNFQAIQDLVVNDSSSQMVNKLTYYPKVENVLFKNTLVYYLLTNGELTQDIHHPHRYKSVKPKAFYYTDNDYPTLLTKARSEMIASKLDHNITFTIKSDNDVFQPMKNIELGDFVEFVNNEQTYDSVVTSIKFSQGFHKAMVTLGEYRIKLTEKIQLLNKSVNSAMSHISIQSTGITDLDGGEF